MLRYLFIAEGTSDLGLGPALAELCVRAGANEVQDVTPDLGLLPRPPGKGLFAQLRACLAAEPSANLIFLHRDANGAGREARLTEMQAAVAAAECRLPWVPVIPERMLEAWLLLDEDAIRAVANNPRGRAVLGLPSNTQVETVADPKAFLVNALALASEQRGMRLKKFKQSFPAQRHQLLARLDVDGPVARLESWRRLQSAIDVALRALSD